MSTTDNVQNDNTDPADPDQKVDTPPAPTSDPEFDGPFDEERAKRLIAALRADKQRAQEEKESAARERDEFKSKWQAHEQELLTDEQRREQEITEMRQKLANANRKAALTKHKLPESALIFLTAEDEEGIEAQAAALAELTPAKDDAPNTDDTNPDLHRSPSPSMQSVLDQLPPSEPNFDPRAIALKARR